MGTSGPTVPGGSGACGLLPGCNPIHTRQASARMAVSSLEISGSGPTARNSLGKRSRPASSARAETLRLDFFDLVFLAKAFCSAYCAVGNWGMGASGYATCTR
jgi:hypothetical protein